MKNHEKVERLNFALPSHLLERVRKEAYVNKVSKAEVMRRALESYFIKK